MCHNGCFRTLAHARYLKQTPSVLWMDLVCSLRAIRGGHVDSLSVLLNNARLVRLFIATSQSSGSASESHDPVDSITSSARRVLSSVGMLRAAALLNRAAVVDLPAVLMSHEALHWQQPDDAEGLQEALEDALQCGHLKMDAACALLEYPVVRAAAGKEVLESTLEKFLAFRPSTFSKQPRLDLRLLQSVMRDERIDLRVAFGFQATTITALDGQRQRLQHGLPKWCRERCGYRIAAQLLLDPRFDSDVVEAAVLSGEHDFVFDASDERARHFGH